MAVRKVGSFLGLVVLSLLAWAAQATTADAHIGNQARLYVAHIGAQPAQSPGSWALMLHIIDEDSGRPVPGLVVSVTGRAGNAAFGPLPLADASNQGMYSGTFAASPGAVSVEVDARPGPGSEPAIPLQRAWKLVLRGDGMAESPAGGMQMSGHSGHGGVSGPQVLAVLLASSVLVAGVVLVLAARRHESLHLQGVGQRHHS